MQMQWKWKWEIVWIFRKIYNKKIQK